MNKNRSISQLLAVALVFMLAMTTLCTGETAGADAPVLTEGADLRIMSFNIMHPDWSRVAVTGRDEIVAAILSCYRPDVVALQEAGAKWHKALIPLLVDTGLYAQACRKSNADGFTYCTTTFLYNPATLSLVEEQILDLDYRDAARVFSVAVFERLSDSARFVVTNTHPAPRDEPPKYARNMADLTTFAAATVEKYADLPVILCGDFNTPDYTEVYQSFMREVGVRDAKYEAELTVRSCSTFFGYQAIPDPDNADLCVDHIFVNDKVGAKLFNVVIDHDVLNASDHTPIYADVRLK